MRLRIVIILNLHASLSVPSTTEFLSFSTVDILEQIILIVGAVLCLVGYIAASLASTH